MWGSIPTPYLCFIFFENEARYIKTNMQIIPSYKYTAYTHARTRNRARARKVTISGHRGHAGVAAPQPSGRHYFTLYVPDNIQQTIISGMVRSTMRRHPANTHARIHAHE